jgi:hypothetical protein
MEKKYFDCAFIKEDISEKGIFQGYGSTFGGDPDDYGDIVVSGAFKETLKKGGRNGNGVCMLWQHRSDKPIGVYEEIEENRKGLRIVGQLALEVQQGKEAYILMKMGALNGLSIGWDFLRDENNNIYEDSYEIVKTEEKSKRYLKRLELWEISPATFPANRRATIVSVKDAIKNAKNIRDFENALRDEGNLSHNAAKYIASICKPTLEKNWNKYTYEMLHLVRDIRKKIGG